MTGGEKTVIVSAPVKQALTSISRNPWMSRSCNDGFAGNPHGPVLTFQRGVMLNRP